MKTIMWVIAAVFALVIVNAFFHAIIAFVMNFWIGIVAALFILLLFTIGAIVRAVKRFLGKL